MTDRYQSSETEPGTMPTVEWFAALMRGIDGPLGTVLDVGSAEGVMSLLAAKRAESVLGIGLTDDRMATAKAAADGVENVRFEEMYASEMTAPHWTVIYSMMAHWLGKEETRRFAQLAERNFCVIFRLPNDFYAIPENGTWFPTLEEMDETVWGVRTHEELVLTQDHGKETWAATYRTDMHHAHGWVDKVRPGFDPVPLASLVLAKAPIQAKPTKHGYSTPFFHGTDLHGDPPFRPVHEHSTVLKLGEVRDLARGIAKAALASGWYPTDFSPRNIIVNEEGAHLVDLDEIERHEGRVAERYLSIWQSVLPGFSGDFRELL